ncbi:MerR family transcriptional regulator [Cellulomonas cellasea]|uniref:HTH merR-type domain-containing protein n=2 Tax=Cellulomonas cellasea TaxID=43670 RepID=A0A0A0B626_9CELL|nr:MerR family transcriptional regulator [Cellulomonas cellasea]KGM01643.1 hypothetical protein Q760_18210 [Cellulomonas cellasea DSM 20118]GEA87978.1 hypothetical protein CCE01nite_19270 [Cellulomonas cellasea]
MGYRIAEAAALVGVAPTTLRYYEDIGLLATPSRGSNGYRVYDDRDVARLRFVAAVKNLGLPLTDVRALVEAYDVEDCAGVAHHVVEMVAARLGETQERIGELVALAAQLQGVAARLADAPAGSPCGEGCPCATAAPEPLPDGRTLVPLTRAPEAVLPATRVAEAVLPATGTPPPALPLTRAPEAVLPLASAAAPAIACSLDAGAVPERVSRWRALVAQATHREPVDGGTALVFPADPGLAAEVARLATAEQACCGFFDFTVRLARGQVRLEVRAPDEAADVVAAMFGPTA